MFIFGFAFGGARILLRQAFLVSLNSNEIGRMVSLANAIGFPVVTLFAFLYGFFFSTGEISPLICFLLFFTFLLAGSFMVKK